MFFRLLNLLLLRSWHVRKEVRRWLRGAPPGARVLDAGSGFGQYVWFVSRLRKDIRVKGIDVKDEEVETGNRFFGGGTEGSRVIFEKADLLEFCEPETYDLALCIDVLEHIEEDVRVMSNICRSLKPGGTLIISTPSDLGGSDVHGDEDHSFIGEHVRDGYSTEEISGKLTEAGYSSVEARYTYGRWGSISWKISMKFPIWLLGRGRIFFLLLPVWYLLTFPVALVLNFFDIWTLNRTGTGLLVKAVK